MRKAFLPVMLVAAGCSGGDPAIDLLRPGDQAIVVLDGGTSSDGRPFTTVLLWKDKDSVDCVALAPGVRVTVGDDPGFLEKTQAEIDADLKAAIAIKSSEDRIQYLRDEKPRRDYPPNPISQYRKVQVVVETGEHRGAACSISRMNLRPAE